MPTEILNGVKNNYGPTGRHEAQVGVLPSDGSVKQLVITFTGANYSLVSAVLPAGSALVGKPMVEVSGAFALTGTNPTILIGSTTPATNNAVNISKAQAEAVGTYTPTPAGIHAVDAVLASSTLLTITLGGTTPAISGAGACKVVIPYRVI